ncbi:uncharacterized protein IWZ02DRAFT_54752 [Phyllosticta citriasiana]|uniref:uncharacterized protein n=1 Tax=Phyllosticta citriasiana TaxID=595635 RepID=UPI0030FDA7C1
MGASRCKTAHRASGHYTATCREVRISSRLLHGTRVSAARGTTLSSRPFASIAKSRKLLCSFVLLEMAKRPTHCSSHLLPVFYSETPILMSTRICSTHHHRCSSHPINLRLPSPGKPTYQPPYFLHLDSQSNHIFIIYSLRGFIATRQSNNIPFHPLFPLCLSPAYFGTSKRRHPHPFFWFLVSRYALYLAVPSHTLLAHPPQLQFSRQGRGNLPCSIRSSRPSFYAKAVSASASSSCSGLYMYARVAGAVASAASKKASIMNDSLVNPFRFSRPKPSLGICIIGTSLHFCVSVCLC